MRTADRVAVRSTNRRFKPIGEVVEVTRGEAQALIAEGNAEYIKGDDDAPTPKGRYDRRDMRAKS